MRSVSATIARPLAVAACVCLLGAGAAGCSTTQEKAAAQKVKSEHILKAQAERKAAKKHHKAAHKHHHSPADGPKTGHQGRKSAHRHRGGEEG
ncbi:MAG TPA: hypothetical protein VH268_06880 [Solirubrobacterales bacterium]|nr:hypothetical protein [Solirubrobacterales bacterium]